MKIRILFVLLFLTTIAVAEPIDWNISKNKKPITESPNKEARDTLPEKATEEQASNEIVSSTSDIESVRIAIERGGKVMVYEKRKIKLPKGISLLKLEGIASTLKPETVRIKTVNHQKLNVYEQEFVRGKKPTLVWNVDAEQAFDSIIEVSYQAWGLHWSANYSVVFESGNINADMQAWVTLKNRFSSGYTNANIELISNSNSAKGSPFSCKKCRKKITKKQGFRYSYSLDRYVDILQLKNKQIAYFSKNSIEAKKKYILQGVNPEDSTSPQVSYIISNTTGKDLPAGNLTLYTKDASGKEQLIQQTYIEHTSIGENITLNFGKDNEILARGNKLTSDKSEEGVIDTYQITVQNKKKESVSLDYLTYFHGNWKITKTSHPFTKIEENSVSFPMEISPESETVIEFIVLTKP
jgi:hypothetical protein